MEWDSKRMRGNEKHKKNEAFVINSVDAFATVPVYSFRLLLFLSKLMHEHTNNTKGNSYQLRSEENKKKTNEKKFCNQPLILDYKISSRNEQFLMKNKKKKLSRRKRVKKKNHNYNGWTNGKLCKLHLFFFFSIVRL